MKSSLSFNASLMAPSPSLWSKALQLIHETKGLPVAIGLLRLRASCCLLTTTTTLLLGLGLLLSVSGTWQRYRVPKIYSIQHHQSPVVVPKSSMSNHRIYFCIHDVHKRQRMESFRHYHHRHPHWMMFRHTVGNTLYGGVKRRKQASGLPTRDVPQPQCEKTMKMIQHYEYCLNMMLLQLAWSRPCRKQVGCIGISITRFALVTFPMSARLRALAPFHCPSCST
jgi:hypothetical protein